MNGKTIPVGSISNDCADTTVIGRINGNQLCDVSGSLLLESHSFKDNDIVVIDIKRLKNDKWIVKSTLFHASSLNDIPDNIWRMSSIYADINKKHWDRLLFRHKLIQQIREYFIKNSFIEIDSPILRLWEDSTHNNLFITTMGSRGYPRLNLRSCPEEYTRRAVIPFFRAFEIGKSFRNEDSYRGNTNIHSYLPEFTLVEFYETPADFQNAMNRLEELILNIIDILGLPKTMPFKDFEISFELPFQKVKVIDAIKEYGEKEGADFLKKMNATSVKKEELFIELNHILDKKVKPKLFNPTFLTHFPKQADVFPDIFDAEFVLRSELVCGTLEIGEVGTLQSDTQCLESHITNAVNDRHVTKQASESLLDKDYLFEIKRNIPSIGGGALGIDRLLMILTNSTDISDVVWYPFPLVKE